MQIVPENFPRTQEKTSLQLNDLMQDVLKQAMRIGATDASVEASHQCGFSVDVRKQQVETVAFNEDKGVSLTIYIGQRQGRASSSDTSPAALEKMVLAAYEIAGVSAVDSCFGLPDLDLKTSNYPDLDLHHPWTVNPNDAIDLAKACEEYAFSYDAKISNSDGVNISTAANMHGFITSQGSTALLHSTRHQISCSLLAEDNGKMQRDYEYTASRNPKDLYSIQLLAEQSAQNTINRLGAKKISTQKVPVLFSSRVSSSLFSSFVSAISGSNLYRRHSFLLDALGQEIFPQFIHVYEQPHLLGALGSSPFDGEGVLTRPNTLIKDGIINQYVLSSYTARKLGLKTTANSGGVNNLTIDPTAGGLDDLVKLMHRGLIVTELMGQGVNILTGDYSRGAVGFWVEGGEIKHPVEEITIAGNLKDMFKLIVAVGSDKNPNKATRCGSVLVEEMMLSGH